MPSRAGRILVIGTAALFAVRALMALTRTGPVLMADEGGYLAHARVLAGGLEFEMGSSPYYRGGYSVLLSPLVRLGADPGLTYTMVLVLNAALAASLVPLLYLLLTRSFGAGTRPALAGAIAGAAYPTVTSISQTAQSENALFPLTVLWLLAVGALLRARGREAVAAGLAAGAAAGALWIVHGRMIVAVAVTAVTLVGLALHRRIAAAACAAGLAALGCGLLAGRLLNGFLIDRNYDGRAVDEVGDTLGSLDDLDAVLAVLRNLAGGGWYLLVATFGIAGVLLAVHGRATATRLRRRDYGPAELSMALLLATTAGLIVITALWFVDGTRPDQIVYGRYMEPMVPPLLAVGVITLMRQARLPVWRAVLAGVLVLTVVLAALRSGLEFPGEDANRWSVSSLPFLTGDLGPVVIVGAGIAALAGAAALALAARRRPGAVWLVLLVLFVPITAFTEVRLVLRGEHDVYPAGWTSPETALGGGADTIAYDTAHADSVAVKVYQWFLPDSRFELFDGGERRPPARLFISTAGWSREHPGLPAEALWRDPGRDQALWRLIAAGP